MLSLPKRFQTITATTLTNKHHLQRPFSTLNQGARYRTTVKAQCCSHWPAARPHSRPSTGPGPHPGARLYQPAPPRRAQAVGAPAPSGRTFPPQLPPYPHNPLRAGRPAGDKPLRSPTGPGWRQQGPDCCLPNLVTHHLDGGLPASEREKEGGPPRSQS